MLMVQGCLHLKSAATLVADNTLLINRRWVDSDALKPMKFFDVDSTEPHAGNALLLGDVVVYSASNPATRKKLEHSAITVREVDISELGKAEGGLTCCSLIFRN